MNADYFDHRISSPASPTKIITRGSLLDSQNYKSPDYNTTTKKDTKENESEQDKGVSSVELDSRTSVISQT